MTHAPLLVPVGDPAGVGPVVAITAAARAVHDDRVVLLGDTIHATTPHLASGAGIAVEGAVVLAESHLAVHTWPELDAVTLDLYVCNHSRDNRAAAESAYCALATAFQAKRCVRRDIERGAVADVPGLTHVASE